MPEVVRVIEPVAGHDQAEHKAGQALRQQLVDAAGDQQAAGAESDSAVRRVDAQRGGSAPALIMLSTDGYANCFGDDEAFFKVGGDFLEYLKAEGPSFVRDKLADWLQQSSRDGSGDDITVGLAAHDTALPPKKKK